MKPRYTGKVYEYRQNVPIMLCMQVVMAIRELSVVGKIACTQTYSSTIDFCMIDDTRIRVNNVVSFHLIGGVS